MMIKCDCSSCKGIDFPRYCGNCGHGICVMEIHSRGPSWDGICNGCHHAEYKALQARRPIKHVVGNHNGVSFEYHDGTTVVLGRVD